MRPAPLLLLATLALGLAGCATRTATTEWVKPGVSEDERQSAITECRYNARDKVETAVGLQRLTDPDMPLASSTDIRQNLQRYDAERKIKRLFENCMREQGYRPVQSDAGK